MISAVANCMSRLKIISAFSPSMISLNIPRISKLFFIDSAKVNFYIMPLEKSIFQPHRNLNLILLCNLSGSALLS